MKPVPPSEPIFTPFRGARYRDTSPPVTAPPYDVIDPQQAAALRASAPHNVVRLDLPVPVGDPSIQAVPGTAARITTGTLASSVDDPAAVRDAHRQAAHLLESWVASRVLVVDAQPSFYLYRQGYRDPTGTMRETAGVVGALALGTDNVLPHEETTSKAASDRLVSLTETQANISMVYGLSLARELVGLLDPEGPPVAHVTDEEGVRHRLWRITSPTRIDAIRRVVNSAPVVIADGHHRYAVACRYMQDAPEDGPVAARRIMAYVVPLDPEFLVVRPIHRVLSRLDVPPATLAARLADIADTSALAPNSVGGVPEPGSVTFLTRRHAWTCRPRMRPADRAKLGTRPPATGSLLVTWVHEVLLPHVGAADVVFHHDATEARRRLAAGEAAACVLLPPVTVDDIAHVAAAGERMPPKTTFFWPKARTGLVLRRFVDQADLG